jgi:4-hydroxy-tetrahydrodipicolinate synthase
MSSRGVFVPLITPLDDTGAVCRQSVGQIIAHTRFTASGYIPCLSSGEGWLLGRSQWEAMVRYTLELAEPRAVIAGIERATTDEVIEYGRAARRLGARAIMLTAPFGGDIDQPAIFEHYRRVHDACDLDLYIYNESSLSGNVTAFETLLAVAELPRVVGIKDSGGVHPSMDASCRSACRRGRRRACMEQIAPRRLGDSGPGGRGSSQIAALQRRGLAYFVGWEHHLARGLPVDGNVVSLANLEPALCRLGLESAEEAVHAEIVRLSDAYSLRSDDWYRHVKRALKARGVIGSDRVLAS